ncbi:hypothetical protein PQX77_004942 [Marasmius sp. AFHP31]|nr:hypothetical protein PQX77_004942 [Marasmius sp. AFHP31]
MSSASSLRHPLSASRSKPVPSLHTNAGLLSLPTKTEFWACWELCRLQNGMGCWLTWLPTAWSIAMAYHAHSEILGKDALYAALLYLPLCMGIKSLVSIDIDLLVARTKTRPIPRGAITVERAWLFFGFQVALGIFLAVKLLDKTS